jgi:hypothetical protein
MHEPFCGVNINKKEKGNIVLMRGHVACGHQVCKSCDYQKCIACYYKWAFTWKVKSRNTGKLVINDMIKGCIKKYEQEE